MPKNKQTPKTKKMPETLGQKDKPVVAKDGENASLLTPLKVVQLFIATVKTDTYCQELADMYILSFFGRTHVPLMAVKNVPAVLQHEAFEKAVPVSRTEAENYRMRLKRSWVQQHRIFEKEARRLSEAPNLHLRAESDDEERPPSMVQRPPKPELDFDTVSFVESLGVIRMMHRSRRAFTLDKPIKVKLTLGYRLLPGSFDPNVEILNAIYETECPTTPINVSALTAYLTDNETDSSEVSGSSDDDEDTSSEGSADSDEMPPPAARKRQSTNNAAEVQPKRQAGPNGLRL